MAGESGGNRFHTYLSTDAVLIHRQEEIQWVARISEAIKSGRLALYYQHIVPLSETEDTGLHIEVLVRMLDEHGAVVDPGNFLPAAERYHLMPAIDRWVVIIWFPIWTTG